VYLQSSLGDLVQFRIKTRILLDATGDLRVVFIAKLRKDKSPLALIAGKLIVASTSTFRNSLVFDIGLPIKDVYSISDINERWTEKKSVI
jgi:hypothetical protein